jgi:hypothetical protein
MDQGRERSWNIWSNLTDPHKKYGRSRKTLALATVLFSHVLYQLSYLGNQGFSVLPLVRYGPERPIERRVVEVSRTPSSRVATVICCPMQHARSRHAPLQLLTS